MEISQKMAREVLLHHGIELGSDQRSAIEVATLFLKTGKTAVAEEAQIPDETKIEPCVAEPSDNTVY